MINQNSNTKSFILNRKNNQISLQKKLLEDCLPNLFEALKSLF